MNSSSSPNPVVLVHGLNDTTAVFNTLAAYLTQQGRTVYRWNLTPCNGSATLECLAQQLATYIEQHIPAPQPLDLVGFSMGGMVSRYYLQRLGGVDQVQRFVSISAPNHGTWIAYGSTLAGCCQMRPNSPFIQDLNRDGDVLGRLNLTTLWTPMDLMIVPASSSRLPIGHDLQIPVALHAWMVRDQRTLQQVEAALSAPRRQPPQPTAAVSPTCENSRLPNTASL